MSDELVESGLFVLGLVLIGGLFWLVRTIKARDSLSAALQWLLESRIYYGLAGILGGYTLLPSLQDLAADIALWALAFLGGWFGLIAGCGLDFRVLRRSSFTPLLLEGMQAGLVMVVVILSFYVSGRSLAAGDFDISGSILLMVCSICVLGVARPTQPGQEPKSLRQQGFWKPSLAAFLGILLAALGNSQLHGVPFQIDYPFATEGRGILVEGLADKMLWSLVLGGMTGLIGDLLSREVERAVIFYLLVGVLLLGSGMASNLGFEPLLVGLVAGMWLINATLRRLDVFEILERGHGLVKIGLLIFSGWLLGHGLAQGGADIGVFFWVLLLLVVLGPAVRLGGLQATGRALGRNVLKGAYVEAGGLLDLDDLVLAVAAGLTGVLPAPVGLAVLGAVMVGQFLLSLARVWVHYLAARHPGIAGLNGDAVSGSRGSMRSSAS